MHPPTTHELTAGTKVLVLPLGAWEQHGPHLPLHTDTVIVEAVIAASLGSGDIDAGEFLVAPSLAITASDEHDGFVGGLSCGTDALVDTVVAICRSASWAKGVCVVNGHGGNADALARIASALEHERIPAIIWSLPSYAGGDMHAGHTETSLLLHIAPHLVRHELIEPGAVFDAASPEAADAIEAMRAHGVGSVSPNGVLGDPTTATATHGRAVLELYVSSLTTTVRTALDRWSMPPT